MQSLDLQTVGLRQLNATLQADDVTDMAYTITNPMGAHAIACGLNAKLEVTIEGHAGFYCAGMNQQATVTVNGHAGVGLAENMMSGTVRVTGNASQAAGGLLVIEGDASSRCGISMKGIDIVVGGSVGHMSGFMAQAGNLVICGDAGEALGDSIYEAVIYVQGEVESLGADCEQKPMTDEHLKSLAALLARADIDAKPDAFKRYGSARKKQPQTTPRYSATFDEFTLSEIRRAASTGIYDIRGGGAKRKLPHFDDLLFLGASMSRYPLEGYRETCGTNVLLGDRHASKPLEIAIPITIAGMSFGSLSGQAKEALGRGANAAGTSTTTGDGGMTPEEREHSALLVYQYLPSRYGMNPNDLRKADAIEIVVGQGAKPGGGGMLMGQKISARLDRTR